LSGKERWTVIVSLFCILLMISLSWFALSTVQKDRFTEFYILNDKGQAYDYPKNLTAGENSSLIIGLVNHEGRKTNYTVEFWLTNFTFLNMTVNVTHQYYVGGFNVVLDSVQYKLDSEWKPQYEITVPLNLTTPGNYTLLVVLFNDGKPVYDFNGSQLMPIYTPLDRTVDYHTDPYYTWRVVLCMRQDMPYLKLVMNVI